MIPAAPLREIAAAEGFDWFGAARPEPLDEERGRFAAWLAEGRHGDMAWLAEKPARRADPSAVLESCRSVIVLGMNYLREEVPRGAPPPQTAGLGRISRYARTRDYHRVIEKALRRIARAIDRDLAPGSRSLGYVDYGPVMERPWAARAGLGFIGKHTLLINPAEGSFHFLGAILTTAEFELSAVEPPTAGCGDCRRCLDACPTGAITEPWRLDARRCLSYLTIEKKGPIEEEFWPLTEGFVFGCDICQDVCPYNRTRAQPTAESPLGGALVPAEVRLAELIARPAEFLARLGETSSPLKRAGAESLARNALIAATTAPTEETLAAAMELSHSKLSPDWLVQTAAQSAMRQAARLAGINADEKDAG